MFSYSNAITLLGLESFLYVFFQFNLGRDALGIWNLELRDSFEIQIF